jgi:hypothetical protein
MGGCLPHCAHLARGSAVTTGTFGTVANVQPSAGVSSACDSHRRSGLAPHMCSPWCRQISGNAGDYLWPLCLCLQYGQGTDGPTDASLRGVSYAGPSYRLRGWTVSLVPCPIRFHSPLPLTVTFDRMSDAVYALTWDRQRWWCATCDCPLFVCDPCFEITAHAHLGIVWRNHHLGYEWDDA